jgi:hypothetical protein
MVLEGKDLKEYIIRILKEDGMALQTAKNIASGSQPMDKLSRAIRLSKKPYFVSIYIWEDIYKGINKVEK